MDGTTFSTDRYCQEDKIAGVEDIADAISSLAHRLAASCFIHVEGHDPDPALPSSRLFADLLPRAPETAIWLRRLMKSLTITGLVGFARLTIIGILAGSQSHRFGVLQDSCWALLGALELENVQVSYNLDKEEIKRWLLVSLVEKYRWMVLELPGPEFRIENESGTRSLERIDVPDSIFLPLHLFLVESKADPEVDETSVPVLSFSDCLTIKAAKGKTIILFYASARR